MIRLEAEPTLEQLYRFFSRNLQRTFADLSLPVEKELLAYLADRLTFFVRTERLYRISSLSGRRLETVVDLLLELEAIRHGELLDRQQEELLALRHLGDFTLFMSGIFREYVSGRGVLDLYLQKGAEAYGRLAQQAPDPEIESLFLPLSRRFEAFSGALDYMKKVYFHYEPLDARIRELLAAIS